MRDKILLIDGHSILNRAFYGIRDLTDGSGRHTNAIYGFMNMMLHMIDEEKPAYLAVAFDLSAPTFRHKMYTEYKGTRKPMPEELREQVPLMKQMLQAMGVPLMILEGYEADDLIGTVSLQCEEAGLEVTVFSGDRDLLQLASDHVCIRIPKTKKTGTEIENYYAGDVKEAYMVPPAGIVDLKALMGDASDNIPGIPGVGEKTAGRIIAEYGTIENAYAHVDEIKPNKAQTSLREHYDLAQLSKRLAAIDRHAPFQLDLKEAELTDLFTTEALALCRELDLRNFISRFEQAGVQETDFHYETITDAGELDLLDRAMEHRPVGLSLLRREDMFGELLGAAVSIDGEGTGKTFFISSEVLSAWRPADCPDAGSALQELIKGASSIDAADVKSAADLLEQIPEERFFDTAVAVYLLNPLKSSYSYDEAARDYAGITLPAPEQLLGKKTPAAAYVSDKEKAQLYCSCLAYTSRICRSRLEQQLEETGMKQLFDEVEMPLVFTLYRMQKEGIRVRSEQLKEYGEKLLAKMQELEAHIYEQAGRQFNINSPKQLGVILFEEMQLPYGKKTKTGYSTAADVLDKLAPEYPFVADILDYRQFSKLYSTYAEGLYAYIGEDGRIHGRFNQTITATGRISSTDPNLQNIPVRTALGRELRKVFVPKDGCLFVDADYSQIELRVLAHASGDENLIGAYNEADDIHAITASQVFHVPLKEVTPQLRRNAKAVNFGIVYGISSFGLSQGLSISRKEAQEYIEQYFRTYPGIKAFLDNSVAFAKEKGYSVTLFGRRRPIPELASSNFMQRSFGERVAMNAPIQGSAADIIKIAMIRVERRMREEKLQAKLILQVHDELLIEAPVSEIERVKEILREEMMGAADLSVPLEIDMNEGASWYDAH